MKILVTGGAGFIGSHLVDDLVHKGHTVVVVDDLSTGQRSNINPDCEFHKLNIVSDHGRLRKLFKTEHFEFVFHLAAAARIPWCIDHPRESHDINVTATLQLLELSRKHRVEGFIYSSSSSVYGNASASPLSERNTPIKPISIYGLQKYAAEQYCKLYHDYYGLNTVSLRYFNVYGTSRQNPNGPYPNVFSSFYRDKQTKGFLTIFGDGKQKRDFVHVYDVVRANAMFIEKPMKFFGGKIFNVGTGETTDINEIANYFDTEIKYEPARQGDPMYSCADASAIRIDTGWEADYSIDEGVKVFFESYEK